MIGYGSTNLAIPQQTGKALRQVALVTINSKTPSSASLPCSVQHHQPAKAYKTHPNKHTNEAKKQTNKQTRSISTATTKHTQGRQRNAERKDRNSPHAVGALDQTQFAVPAHAKWARQCAGGVHSDSEEPHASAVLRAGGSWRGTCGIASGVGGGRARASERFGGWR